ncbi:MAG: saccharopine dehydrogenase NADP-binding domain-containing protein [Anaerolineales bacterium]|nr:saccharopine dehydrogenase NADP-binding domain-containing protein [Chloroflexota bacterium]MBL6979771.1 saccharopine dehydrogenase NADP-binding domain-containing protein [Anaerolineales bacterium]
MSQFTYAVLGAGRQGTAAAYDLAKFSDAKKIILADINQEIAEKSAKRINQLIGRDVAVGVELDVSDKAAILDALKGVDVTLSAVPYYFNLDITKTCIEAGSSLCDMGGHTGVVRKQLALDAEAKAAGVSIVPDCGMGPGLNVTMAAYAQELLDETHSVHIFDGGLPQKPTPPWNYQATFHINGLTNEMDGQATFLRDGILTPVDTLTEPEFIEFDTLGSLEADVTSGGLSTSPWTFEGKLQNFTNKTLRYPGHFEWLRAFKELGLFSEEALQVNGYQIIPREVYHTLLEPKISASEVRDVCVLRVKGYGMKDGKDTTVVIDLIDYYDEATGFTAMERLTGWHCAIMMGFQARGKVPAGGVSMEVAVPAGEFMEAVRERGIEFSVEYK